MNSTYFTTIQTSILNSSTITIESWFISLDIINIIFLILVIILGVLFLFIIIIDKTCHTVPVMLVANSCLATLLFTSASLGMTIWSLKNDLEQISYQDSLCIFRGYFSHVTIAAQLHSYLLQAIYRYITVIYPTRLLWQSKQFQGFLIGLTWVFAFILAIPNVVTGEIQYNADNQICETPFHLSFVIIYNIIYVYFIPMNGIMSIYFKLILYVKEINKRVTPVNTVSRAERELKMVHRIVVLVSILLTLGIPYTIFIFIGFFTQPPKYHFRIAFTFVYISLVFIMITLFQFTDPVKTYITKKLKRQSNIIATTTVHTIEIR
ncbi:unnamed protein product [Adineta steineri]|uniref:G-protein coupled receptors family 1 profile domain-containing protein n=1 Tax=Adineta steineri TaxID=433720 RepID=A0A814IRW2_9BILA|nr:unnamed protein product [Adineta steineri]CAF1028132.1 unnamed protein product [Adineta steineri]CAF1119434.1 unnamed protein product [Adineta steineri]